MEQKYYKNKYSIGEFYTVLYQAVRTMKYMARARKKKLISKEFIERIMLAVTEVNGCPICAYGHTKMALETGMNEEEIKNLLSGDQSEVPAEEAPGVIFAQHYADCHGKPSQEAWERIVELYGTDKAYGILGATRTIMMGNVYGMAMSAFGNRLKGNPVKYRFNVFYELGMLLSIILFLPIVLVQSILASLFKKPIIRF